jgi:5-methylcytosine-specific restriction enzyme subunit McrC
MLQGISFLELTKSDFKSVRLHRNNRFYEFLLHICEMIYDHSLPAERKGEWKFVDFTRDERKMNQLFEAFIRNFYKRNFPEWKIGSRRMKWQFSANINDPDLDYLPIMETDITVEKDDEIIIIDAKYYRETLTSRFNSKKVKSINLYQLFSYLLNQRDGCYKTENAKGILLYPTIDEEYDLEYSYKNHPIQIKTLNLNMHWKKIEERLISIVNYN